AETLAAELGREVWEMRDRTPIAVLTVDAAIDRALAAPSGPVVIADMKDNPSRGAPADNTAILRRLFESGVGDAALGYLWDPVAVEICRSAGIGGHFELRIGGKAGRVSGDPIDPRDGGHGDRRRSLPDRARRRPVIARPRGCSPS